MQRLGFPGGSGNQGRIISCINVGALAAIGRYLNLNHRCHQRVSQAASWSHESRISLKT